MPLAVMSGCDVPLVLVWPERGRQAIWPAPIRRLAAYPAKRQQGKRMQRVAEAVTPTQGTSAACQSPFCLAANDVTCLWHNEGGAERGEGRREGGALRRVENMNDR